jgi:preprotein translocase subunit YajC
MNLISLLADENTPQPKGDSTTTIVMWIILAVVIIAFFIWTTISNKKRQKQEQERLASIKVGDKVKTIGGICGYIVELNDEENTFVVETGTDDKKSYIKLDKQAIYQTASPVEETATEEKADKE